MSTKIYSAVVVNIAGEDPACERPMTVALNAQQDCLPHGDRLDVGSASDLPAEPGGSLRSSVRIFLASPITFICPLKSDSADGMLA